MEIKKNLIPNDPHGKPMPQCEGDYIFFRVKFNAFRDVSRECDSILRDVETMQECECVLRLPQSYSESGPQTQLILFCHGAGSTVSAEQGQIGGLVHTVECTKAGYAVLDVAGSAPNGWTQGCPEHLCALYRAYCYAVTHFHLTERVLVGGASMGGSTAMNFINTYPSIVLAVGLFFPRLNLESVEIDGHFCLGSWDKTSVVRYEKRTTREQLALNYRFENGEWCEETIAGFDPYRTRSFLNSDGERVVIPPCPIKIWHGDADKIIDLFMSEEFVRSVRRSGSYIELHKLKGVGHTANDVMHHELLHWFNRFSLRIPPSEEVL